MFMARMVEHPNDCIIYGRAIGLAHNPGRDDATEEDIRKRPWKTQWPHYIRVHHGEFIAGTIGNGVSLNRLMETLGADSFESTQRNRSNGFGNTNPRTSLRQQPSVKLTPVSYAWLHREFEAAVDRNGRSPDADLARLDWPTLPSGSL